ncbi:hypothetical protein [Bacillus altitudinis]|uniref:hypothetical protein n=1 Tax=Bacillus altitudinis TaxID=293387 RepID=UPI0031F6D475
MHYLKYDYCLSDFVIADNYQVEHCTQEDSLDSEYRNLLSNFQFYSQTKFEQINDLVRRIYVSKEEIAEYLDERKKFRVYNPLNDTPELYAEMNKIVIFDEKSLMKFIKNYGIPFQGQKLKNSPNMLFDSTLFQENDTEKFILGMDVLMFYTRLEEFQRVLKMWNDIVAGNTHEMENIRSEFKSIAEFYDKNQKKFISNSSVGDFSKVLLTDMGFGHTAGEIDDLLQTYKNKPEKLLQLREKASELKTTWEQVKDKPNLDTIAFAYLNLELKGIHSGETSTRFIEGKIVPALKFNNLLEVAGYQLKQAIFKNQRLEECTNCGCLFEPRHASQRFCSPLPGRRRSTCENTYNQRQKRARKKLNR